jgi:gamma-glutamylcyclotransferase (GGCT)/AIG2-like uncharacterized protein YtfP
MRAGAYLAELSMLFVYGTLRERSGHAMARRMARHARLVGAASFQGKLFMVEDYPGVVPSDDPTDIVYGEVYELEQPKRMLRVLDEYEGYDPHAPHCAYLRREHRVVLTTGVVVPAWIYIYNRETDRLERITSGDFSRLTS